MSTHGRDLRTAIVDTADTLAAGFGTAAWLGRLAGHCARPGSVDAAALLGADRADTGRADAPAAGGRPSGALATAAASGEAARRIGLAQLDGGAGPCVDCYTAGRQVRADDLAEAEERWPEFAVVLRAEGYRGVHAVPMRLRDETLGAVGLFTVAPGPLDGAAVDRAGALAAVAAAGLLHRREARRREAVVGQLQTALDSRILIEQAKGVLAERLQVSVDHAFAVLRGHSRRTNRKLVHTARAVVDGSLDIAGSD